MILTARYQGARLLTAGRHASRRFLSLAATRSVINTTLRERYLASYPLYEKCAAAHALTVQSRHVSLTGGRFTCRFHGGYLPQSARQGGPQIMSARCTGSMAASVRLIRVFGSMRQYTNA